MKTVRSLAAMIVVAALAVFVYDFYKRVDRDQAFDEAAVIREQAKVLQEQATAVNQQLHQANEQAAALRDEVAGQRREDAERKEQQEIAMYLAEGLHIAASAKTAVAESYMTQMRWPSSNREAGLPDANQLKGQSLQSVRLSGAGVISLTFDAKSGVDRGVIRLTPKARQNGGAVSWQCESPSYENIATVIAECVYKPQAGS
jgi:hypothetical protein